MERALSSVTLRGAAIFSSVDEYPMYPAASLYTPHVHTAPTHRHTRQRQWNYGASTSVWIVTHH